MRFSAVMPALAAVCVLAACETNGDNSPTRSESTSASPAGNSGVHISGYTQVGGAAAVR